MTTYQAKFGHADNCTPGVMDIEAASTEQAIQQARDFVSSGLRNGTWINVDLGTGAYAARNVHGNAVGETTSYE